MRALLDTNVLVRHFTGGPPGQARRATALLTGPHELIVPDLIVAEFVYVLESFYERPREEIAQAVRSFLALESIAVFNHDLLLQALALYQDHRLDFADAYLAALAQLSGTLTVASFDRRLDRVGGIVRHNP